MLPVAWRRARMLARAGRRDAPKTARRCRGQTIGCRFPRLRMARPNLQPHVHAVPRGTSAAAAEATAARQMDGRADGADADRRHSPSTECRFGHEPAPGARPEAAIPRRRWRHSAPAAAAGFLPVRSLAQHGWQIPGRKSTRLPPSFGLPLRHPRKTRSAPMNETAIAGAAHIRHDGSFFIVRQMIDAPGRAPVADGWTHRQPHAQMVGRMRKSRSDNNRSGRK